MDTMMDRGLIPIYLSVYQIGQLLDIGPWTMVLSFHCIGETLENAAGEAN